MHMYICKSFICLCMSWQWADRREVWRSLYVIQVYLPGLQRCCRLGAL